ncbi:hypothetical protein CBD41_01460 [bacterium TMED181]|nr:hypothetical protein [Planctomycetota bacterium]OUW47130.1 MAG: hypothetical protein CBD41_01460 [bacterium TMED181]
MIHPLLISVLALFSPLQEAPSEEQASVYTEVAPEKMIGKPVPSMEITDIDGKTVDFSEESDQTLVLEFTLPSCRFAQRLYIQKRVQPLINRWGKAGIEWISVDSSFFAHPQRWRDWAEKYSLKHRFLLDQEGQLAESLGVKHSPTYVVIHKGKVAYHGSLDDDIWGQNMDRTIYLDAALKKCESGDLLEKPYNKPYGMAIRTRRVEDSRRKEFDESRKKALEELKKPADQ